MGYAELIQTLQTLPQEKQSEVFDFVAFLANKAQQGRAQTEWTDAAFSELAMRQALRGIENEEIVSYTRTDLKESWK
ncbi:MAG: DUF2281 domain-containing protein [Sideroxydans sp.]|nr:DUF2281 domain-containing protein [Sideroxydans sp.]